MLSPAASARRREPFAWCWRARISVGAISTPCPPASTATASAISATSVLPAPTSPCNSRFMRVGAAMSAAISAIARSCAPVGV